MAAPVVHVFTDVGVKDTDDELLIKYLCSLKDCPLNLTFIFMGSDGLTASDALVYWIRNFESNVLSSINSSSSISYLTIAEYKELDAVSCDYALQIAPMNGYAGDNLTVLGKYVFAGDYATPEGARNSFNKEGSQDILDRFHAQDKLVDIPSAHMVNMRFNEELLSKFTGAFHDNIVFTAFLLIFARMSPDHGANKFAEGLINPAAGRGANYTSVMNMKEVFGIPTGATALGPPPTFFNQIWYAGVDYCESLEKNGVTLKDRSKAQQHLMQMNIVLQSIADQAATASGMEPFCIFRRRDGAPVVSYADGALLPNVPVSDFSVNTIPEHLIPSWKFFKTNAASLIECFNPVYDLFAGYVLMGCIKADTLRVAHTPEEFLHNVVLEF